MDGEYPLLLCMLRAELGLFSIKQLVTQIDEATIVDMADKLCDKTLNGADDRRTVIRCWLS